MENKALNAEIISVGTELLLGHTTNTGTRDISLRLGEIGISVKYRTVVGDNPQRLADCIEIAKRRADIIISTGGLGPTCDDLTKMILAQSFGLELEMNEDERACLYDYLTNKGYSKTMTENNLQQAMLPMYTTGGEERSGMGFTIMESFMDKLKVKSAPGKGTTVTMLRTIRQRRAFR